MKTEYSFESKVTARIDRDLYNTVQKHFHHGQQTLFFRQIFESLKILIEEDKFDEVLDYLYRGKDLILPNMME